jgi:hypothetical protein
MRAEARRPPEEIPEEFRGFLNLVDEERGRQLFITLLGDQIPEELRGRRVSKEYWEVTAGIVQLG